LPLISQPR